MQIFTIACVFTVQVSDRSPSRALEKRLGESPHAALRTNEGDLESIQCLMCTKFTPAATCPWRNHGIFDDACVLSSAAHFSAPASASFLPFCCLNHLSGLRENDRYFTGLQELRAVLDVRVWAAQVGAYPQGARQRPRWRQKAHFGAAGTSWQNAARMQEPRRGRRSRLVGGGEHGVSAHWRRRRDHWLSNKRLTSLCTAKGVLHSLLQIPNKTHQKAVSTF